MAEQKTSGTGGRDALILIGEKLHCTRVYRTDGKFVKKDGEDHYIRYRGGDGERLLPIPAGVTEGDLWQRGRVRQCAVAIAQGMRGAGEAAGLGVDYLRRLAQSQEADGAHFLDLNVDEYASDDGERREAMVWLCGIAQEASGLPLAIDSSSESVLRAGLGACDEDRARPMLNSVSLERMDAADLAAETGAEVVASAAGSETMPETAEDRLNNFENLVRALHDRGIGDERIHLDPLVMPVATDAGHGPAVLEAIRGARKRFGTEIHITGGFSNVSFGLPKRRLVNTVFARLCVEAGADGGIVDPAHINSGALDALDPEGTPFRLARDLLTGQDDFGMQFITAAREGEI
ncbi:dihydropteroate synthase [Kiritimatiella glycovorans]|uniref:5-methyltetrahydrofolate:corrinoid/iron-sulfur protein co-methyltransferase n=1 Tax=Kiritimatiella glycovorans TaxID=1307763 RepID=A0A0G3EM58_9BACT|nr:dihydropteroate synthase [Kiritimatiella glycovorans]AKJ65249.1 5-methyltetrahydrofolate:corrinoid/iron-sulfur protein co-methyltransferase [Kiritimatiella glycovorans]